MSYWSADISKETLIFLEIEIFITRYEKIRERYNRALQPQTLMVIDSCTVDSLSIVNLSAVKLSLKLTHVSSPFLYLYLQKNSPGS